jgi:gamma-glutamyl:cysteine ligase YbdK (ATP-grasp superfamily)
MLKQMAPRMLIIDEIQHLLSCNARDQRAALNAIKYLANTMRMSIVAAGTHESLHAMRYDPQIASRFEQLELPLWGETEEFRRFVAGFIRTLPVRHTAGELDRRAIAYMLELTDGVTGRVVDLLRRAAKYALSIRSKRIGLEAKYSAASDGCCITRSFEPAASPA